MIIVTPRHPEERDAEAVPVPGRTPALPDRCPHPDCRAPDSLIRWGRRKRWVYSGDERSTIWVQRIRCKSCKRTHTLLPDSLHPYRRYVTALMQDVIAAYLFDGLGIEAVIKTLPSGRPSRSTVREWIDSFAYGVGQLLFGLLRRSLAKLDPLTELSRATPPAHLDRVPSPTKRCRLANACRCWPLAEHLYHLVRDRSPYSRFGPEQFLPFLLQWLQDQGIPPRLFWSPRLSTTHTEPF